MKKCFAALLIGVLLLMNGCSFKVPQESFAINAESVTSIEIQKEYIDESGAVSYRAKKIEDAEAIKEVCEKVRYLPVVRANPNEAIGIENMTVIVVIHGKIDHHLVLNSKYAFYDKMPYYYQKKGVLNEFVDLYDSLVNEEYVTEASPF